jgi:glucose dehydrogenase
VDETLYVVTPYPNVLSAFDLGKEDYPLRFKYRPDVNPSAVGVACCDAVNRGAVFAEGNAPLHPNEH